jgi:hypothetical protein
MLVCLESYVSGLLPSSMLPFVGLVGEARNSTRKRLSLSPDPESRYRELACSRVICRRMESVENIAK